jgi:hypothetical protein
MTTEFVAPPELTQSIFRISQRFAARIVGGAGCAVVPFVPPRQCRGDGAPHGATIRPRLARRVRVWRDARAPRRSIAAISVPGSALLEPRICAEANTASSSQGGHSNARSGPGASRVRGYEPRPQAPHLAPSSKRLAKTPSAEPSDVEYSPWWEYCQEAGLKPPHPEERAPRGVSKDEAAVMVRDAVVRNAPHQEPNRTYPFLSSGSARISAQYTLYFELGV